MRFRICQKRRKRPRMAETVMAKDERTRTIAKRGRTEEQRVVQRARAGAYHAAREFKTRAHETAVLWRCVRRPGGLKRKRTKPKTAFRGKFFRNAFCFRRAEREGTRSVRSGKLKSQRGARWGVMSAAMRRALRAAARATNTRTLATSAQGSPFQDPRVTVAYTPKAIDKEVRRVFFSGDADANLVSAPSSLRLVGFDVEHKPETRKGSKPSVHLVQITSPGGDECLLLHVAAAGLSTMTPRRAMRSVPHLVKLLNDKRVVVAGVGVRGDLDRLRSSHASLFETFESTDSSQKETSVKSLDSQAVHLFYHPEAAGASVAALASLHGVAATAQSKSITMSDWSLAPLSSRQIAYAAEDASLSFRIAKRQFERYGNPTGATFEQWAECFLGVDTPAAMDARVAQVLKKAHVLKQTKKNGTSATDECGIPEAMLAAFRKHHSAVTRLRNLRANAARWRAMTLAVAKHASNAPGFKSAVSTLEVLCAAAAKSPPPFLTTEDATSAVPSPMRVRYEHSVYRETVGPVGPIADSTFACAATAELLLPADASGSVPDGADPDADAAHFDAEDGARAERATVLFEGRGRSKRAAKDAAARGVLAAVLAKLDGVWMCSNAAKWAAEPEPEVVSPNAGAGGVVEVGRTRTRAPLRCSLGCGGAGASLVGPRDRRRAGVAQPAHFEDEAGWASCALRLGSRT